MNAKRPHFLEVFLPNFSSQRLEVPSKFVKHLRGRTSGSLSSLTGPSGNSWLVDLVEHKGHLFFDGGWPTFVKDHSIQCGDSLVFRYDGNSNFTVQIFDQTSCEKDEAFYAVCSKKSLNINSCSGKRKSWDMEESFLDVVGEKKHQGTLNPVHLDLPVACRENANSSQKLFNESGNPIVLALSSHANTEWRASIVKSPKMKKASNGKKKVAKKKSTRINTTISKYIGSRVAQYFNSSFPYFIRVMNYSNISGNGTMKIPIRFSEVHFPNCRIKVTLKNLNGDCWMINSIPTAKRHSTMHTFCGGWLAFVRGNQIKIEDVCIFEFVGKFEMLVRILRLGVEGLDTQALNSIIDVCGIHTSGLALETVANVAQETSGGCFLHDSEKNELCIDEHEGHNVIAETISATQQDGELLIDTSDDATAQSSANHAGPFPMSRSFGKLLMCNIDETISSETTRDDELDFQGTNTSHNWLNRKEAAATISFTSPFPNFMKVMMSSNVGGSYTLAVPRKFSAAHLPSEKTEIVLRNLNGESWNVVSTHSGHKTKLCGGWMSFVRKNNVKVGDVCVFELVDEKVLLVHIFEADQKGQEYPSNDAVADDSTASGESGQCIVLPLA